MITVELGDQSGCIWATGFEDFALKLLNDSKGIKDIR
jgi:hypothetical protein